MEELGSLWNYQENVDELKLKLQYSAIELESVRMEAGEQIRKCKEELEFMLHLLNLAYQERDEARDQLQKMLNKLIPYETPFMIAAKTNSSITESNSLSDTYNNHHSHGSSPVDSLFDAVTSPDFPIIKMADSSGIGLLNQPFASVLVPSTVATKVVDAETAVIDNLARGKTLPEKRKLLQAVMEAGPLLSTLLVAGPLPRWRNPPPSDAFKIPHVSIKACDTKIHTKTPVASPINRVVKKGVNSSLYHEVSRGTYRMCSSAMLGFAGSGSTSWLSQLPLSSDDGVNTQIPVTKRQRF
ncbi:ABC transporter B family member 20-like isoform 1 [Hibiscus syriacus]|uniref:ABC transporter B family member 20-like isoform 1 n=1 Tax=Hibiscus syriacus TaxID=106335 RepID=A0A6A2ZB93_HIBSY|nr:uncharacterized protein LOC120148163 [Hibiscus syriacus]KAE8688863.1 ABC transporter B family member 20-like isoform 1 [Hibiscus syriacus]